MARTLDPTLLDAIVAEMDIADLATFDRIKFAIRLFFDDIEAWLRRLASDESSWLNRLADMIGGGGEYLSNLSLFDIFFIAMPISIVALALCAAAIFLWRHRSRTPRPGLHLPYLDLAMTPATAPAIDELPGREQPAALFRQACSRLEARGVLHIRNNLTNSTIARSARLPGQARQSLVKLAHAADRALFGGWQPSAADLQSLHDDYRLLLGAPVQS